MTTLNERNLKKAELRLEKHEKHLVELTKKKSLLLVDLGKNNLGDLVQEKDNDIAQEWRLNNDLVLIEKDIEYFTAIIKGDNIRINNLVWKPVELTEEQGKELLELLGY